MHEDETTKIQEIPEGWMLSSIDSYVIKQYKSLCWNNGKTEMEKLGIFDTLSRVEKILDMIQNVQLDGVKTQKTTDNYI